jgi:glutaredoxin
MMTDSTPEIILYGTRWCGDTRRTRAFLDQHSVLYQWIDIDTDLEAAHFVEQANRGFRSVPTITFPDGSILVEAPISQLAVKLGLPYP